MNEGSAEIEKLVFSLRIRSFAWYLFFRSERWLCNVPGFLIRYSILCLSSCFQNPFPPVCLLKCVDHHVPCSTFRSRLRNFQTARQTIECLVAINYSLKVCSKFPSSFNIFLFSFFFLSSSFGYIIPPFRRPKNKVPYCPNQ